MANKFFFLLCVLFNSPMLSAQPVELVNLVVNNKESRVVYIGMDNFFKINNFKKYKGITPATGIKLLDDKLLITPTAIGPLTVHFITKSGRKEPVTFRVKRMPFTLLAIGNHTRTTIDKTYLLEQKKLALKSADIEDSYLEGYEVKSFTAVYNGQTFNIEGSDFPAELLEAIQKSGSGTKIIIGPVKAHNAAIDRHFNVDSKIAFTIK